MRLLIYSGFNPRQKDNFGQTPLHLACINGTLLAVQELCEQVHHCTCSILIKKIVHSHLLIKRLW